jgi:N-acyl-D-aspartate/D-glutamate deacylase
MIREGLFADIVIFDLSRIADPATFDDPRHFPEGIEFVLINGKVVVEQEKYHKSLAGKVLRR